MDYNNSEKERREAIKRALASGDSIDVDRYGKMKVSGQDRKDYNDMNIPKGKFA